MASNMAAINEIMPHPDAKNDIDLAMEYIENVLMVLRSQIPSSFRMCLITSEQLGHLEIYDIVSEII